MLRVSGSGVYDLLYGHWVLRLVISRTSSGVRFGRDIRFYIL